MITADDVLACADSWYPGRSPADLLTVLRAEQSGFVPTWLSAWATRDALTPALTAEVAAARARAESLRQAGARIAAAVPGVVAIKGLAVSDRYPAGLARRIGDLDLVVPDTDTLWQAAKAAAAVMRADVTAVATFPVREPGGRGTTIAMRAPRETALEEPVGLDIGTHALVGNGSTVPARAWIGRPGEPEPAAHLVLVAAKALDRPIGLKQVLDAAVLAERLGPAGLDRARELAGAADLLPELGAAFALAARHGLPVPERAPVAPPGARLARVRRGVRFAAACRRRPLHGSLRLLQHVELQARDAAPVRRRAWHAVDRRLPVLAPARDGLIRFGLPVIVTGDTDRPVLRSPFGDYLLVTSSQVTEDWLDGGLRPADDGSG